MKQHFYETRYFIGHEKHKMDIYIYIYVQVHICTVESFMYLGRNHGL